MSACAKADNSGIKSGRTKNVSKKILLIRSQNILIQGRKVQHLSFTYYVL